MNKIILVLSFLIIHIYSIQGQDSKRTNIWYFGHNAGIDFNSTPPLPIFDGQLNTIEGCATLCDSLGQLQIYTDGITIWNKNHAIIPGAINLGGNSSATQSGIIVPLPGSEEILYVFTVDSEGGVGGLQYHTIDLTLNGGLGGLTSSHNMLLNNATEKVTAVLNCNKQDLYIISHEYNNNNFTIWELTNSGITFVNTIPIGIVHNPFSGTIGNLKVSPDGSKLAVAVRLTDSGDIYQLFDFDNQTGNISNPITINTNSTFVYGVEFSPDSKKLYLSGKKIYQINLDLPTNADIINSLTQISSIKHSGIQLGPDGKLYLAVYDYKNYLSTIENPNELGASSNFNFESLYLGGRFSRYGLPNLIPSLFIDKVDLILSDTLYCNATGEITCDIINPTSTDFTYEWYLDGTIIPNATSANINITQSGIYECIVNMYDICQYFEYSQKDTILFPDELEIQNITLGHMYCSNSNNQGSINIAIDGGQAPFSYSNDNGATYQTSNEFQNLNAGFYNIVVTDDRGCEIAETVEIIASLPPNILNIPASSINCINPQATININVNNGTLPLMYSLDNVNFQNSSSFVLPSGNYTIYVVDFHNCTDQYNYSIPDIIMPNLELIDSMSSSCTTNSGLIEVSGISGAAPYSYALNNGSFQSSGTFNNLGSGTYTIILQDQQSCLDTLVIDLQSTEGPSILNIGISPELCNQSNGALSVTATGGTPQYQYSFDGGANFQNDSFITNLPSGIYNLVVEDDNGCQQIESIEIISPELPEIQNITSTELTCIVPTSILTINAINQNDSLLYSLDGINFQNDSVFSNLSSGNYTIFIQDTFGCIDQLEEIISPINLPNIDLIDTVNTTCNESNGSINVEGINGNIPYNFSIDNGTFQNMGEFENLNTGQHQIVLEDNLGCLDTLVVSLSSNGAPTITDINLSPATCDETNGSISITATGGIPQYQYSFDGGVNFQNDSFITNLASGIYNLVVEDENGCQQIESIEINSPEIPNIQDVHSTNLSCPSPTSTLTVHVSNSDESTLYSLDGTIFQNDSIFSNLQSGLYTIYVKDTFGCIETLQETITPLVLPNINLIDSSNTICNLPNGDIQVEGIEGTSPYTYAIDNGPFQNNGLFEDINAGEHQIVIQDNLGCLDTLIVTLEANDAPTIYELMTTPATCEQNNGTALIEVTGGSPLYSYSLNGIDYQNSNQFNDLDDGNYVFYVQDANGCIDTGETSLDRNSPSNITNVNQNATTCNENNGSIEVLVSNENGVQYSLSNSNYQSNNLYTNLPADNYWVYIIDEDNCLDSQLVTILPSSVPNILGTTISPVSCDEINGSITINCEDENVEYSINGIDYIQSNQFSNLPTGNYTIYVKDDNDCKTQEDIYIGGATNMIITDVVTTSSTCDQNNGFIEIEISGGNAPISYYINDIQQFESSFENLQSGTYFINIIDASGCELTQNIEVFHELCEVFIPTVFTPNFDGQNDEFVVYSKNETKIKKYLIFDRWGEKIYEANDFSSMDYDFWWDGRFKGEILNEAVFMYYIEIEFENGEVLTKKGDVTLIK